MSINTLFLNRFTTVDCALLTSYESLTKILGFSFNVSLEISGSVEETEQVIVDFSKLKSGLKKHIDGSFGMDHKLIVSTQSKNYEVHSVLGSNNTDISVFRTSDWVDGFVKDKILSVPNDAIYKAKTAGLQSILDNFNTIGFESVISNLQLMSSYLPGLASNHILPEKVKGLLDYLAEDIKLGLAEFVKSEFPHANIEVERVVCDFQTTNPPIAQTGLNDKSLPLYASQLFPYTHGLNYSSSYGCKNVVHGHLSYIGLFTTVAEDLPDEEIMKKQLDLYSTVASITKQLFNVHFCHVENVKDNSLGTYKECSVKGSLVEHYQNERGIFELRLSEDTNSSLQEQYERDISRNVVLSTETTIENLVSYIAKKFEPALKEIGVSHIYVSEGLHKGSFHKIE